MGKPASIASTPNSSNFIAICNFCSGLTETPGVCSPSLRVVSKILTFSTIGDSLGKGNLNLFPASSYYIFANLSILNKVRKKVSNHKQNIGQT
jgi:hypothetical protein